MRKRIFTLALAMVMILQTMMPVAGLAKGVAPKQKNMVKVGDVDIKSYPQPSLKIIQEANRQKKLRLKGRKIPGGARLFSSPYFPGQDPANDKKPLIYANVNAVFSTKGLDGGDFDWEGVFGKDQDGKPQKAQIVFEQIDYDTSTRTGVKFFLKVDKTGKYTWSDDQGKPTKLPLYSKELKPFKYEVLLDEDVTDHVKLLTSRFFGTEEKYSFGQPDPTTGEIVGEINLDLTLQQVASTKFTSKWNTDVEEANRPTVEGSFLPGNETDPEMYGIFKFPSNDTDKTIIRNDNLDPQNPGEYSEYLARDLEKTPKVDVADPDPDATDTYTLDRDNAKISYKNKTYKYEVKYDVINGGKLTMTEVIPVTFDANGGTFASIPDPNAEQMIKKEVDYDGTLTEKAEEPTKDRETFKGWATAKDGTPLSKEDFDKAIKNIKEAKTFYAIWDNNEITAEELTVHESFKDGTEYVNNFIPSLDTLKGQVKIKDANGDPKALDAGDTFAIVDSTKEYTADGDALKNYLYKKLQEKSNPKDEPTRIETVKAKVTHKNGTSQTVDIPIKVIKNIYEAKTLTEKPYYVPADYVKVIVDPTTKAKDPQKTYYYVNKKAKVVIPGEDPTGTGDNKFVKWTYKDNGTETEYKLADKPRHQFEKATTITAQYVSDVIPANDDGSKPDTVPKNYVEVKFVPTDKATDETQAEKIFWVNPDKEVTIPVKDPVGKTYYTFKEWKIGDVKTGDTYTVGTPKQFTDKNGTTITATYDESKTIIPFDPKSPDPKKTPEGYVKITFEAEKGLELTASKGYYVKKNAVDGSNAALTLKTIKDDKTNYGYPEVKEQTGYTFEKWDPEETTTIGESDIVVTAKAKTADDVVEKKTGVDQPKGYVEVTFVPTDMATDKTEKTFWVNPTKEVTIPMAKPEGKTVKAGGGNPQEYTWVFKNWTSDEKPSRTWSEGINTGVTSKFPVKTTITANYDKKITDQGKVVADEIVAYESVQGVNDFIPTKDQLKAAVKVKDASGADKALPNDATVTFVDDSGAAYADEAALTNALYDKLQEKANPNDEPTRVEKVKAKVTFKNGEVQNVDIPIKVIKNIYKANTDGSKPSYVPKDYVKVTVDPTTKATVPQKTYYYVNPNAQVVIPGENPTGTDGNTFVKWTYPDNGAKKEYKLADHPRHQFKVETTITAQYASDVIPQEDTEKPKDVPNDYVKVIVNPTALAKNQSEKIFWVKKNTDVFIDVKNPEPLQKNLNFSHWEKDGGHPIYLNKKNKFEQQETTIVAKYVSEAIRQPGDNKPTSVPDNYIKVIFDPTDKAQETEQIIFWVAPKKDSVGISVTNPKGKIEKDAKGQPLFTWQFDQWELKKKITKNSWSDDKETSLNLNTNKIEYGEIFKAMYKSPNIIPYNPEEPISRPKGYVRVTFEAEEGIKLTEQKAYYVRANAQNVGGSAIKLGNRQLAKPAYKVETGYEVKLNAENKPAWTPDDTTTIADQDIVVKIGAKPLADTIEKIDENTKKPDGYVEVKFVAGANGQLKNGETTIADKTYFVNPNKYVTLTPPTAVGNTGFEFGSWDKDAKSPTQYKEAVTTITASFNPIDSVIPKIDDQTKKPDGYRTVTFEIEGVGGSIVDGETKVYYVDPNREVTLQAPQTIAETGYEFEKWDQDTVAKAKKYTDDTTVKGNFKKLDDIIPSTKDDGKPNAKPDGYITVTFNKGEHGKEITGQTAYYVNPKADPVKTLGDTSIVKPTVKAETGFKFTGWDTKDDFEIKDNKTVVAQYEELKDVIPKTKDDDSEKPKGYITVTFSTETNGKIKDTEKTEKVVYVNPNKAVVLKPNAPEVTPNTGFDFAGWDTQIEKKIQYNGGETIKALYNVKGDVIPQEKTDGSDKPAGYLTVIFAKGDHGELSGKTVYYVKPNKKVTVPAPDVKPSVGYEFDKWDKALTQTFTKDTTITAGYKPLDNIIPQKNTDGSDKPNGYVAVTFKAVNGTLSGTTTYYVNGEKEVDLTDTAKAITKKANVGFTDEGGTWTPAIESKKYTKDETYTFAFKPLPAVIKKIDENTKKPDGYVTVKLIPTDKATDTTEKIYFVNPTKEVTITNKPEGKKETKDGIEYTYHFKGWTVTKGIVASWTDENINSTFKQETDITAKYTTKVDAGELIPAPVPKKDTVTPKGDVPDASTLIENKDKLPANTTIGYAKGGKPSVDKAGNVTAKVEVKYPNGKTAIVEVPITVVDHVVPQDGGEGGKKPLVPDNYVKVTVDTTNKATDNTKFEKVFWVKPNVDVTIPGIKNPSGKAEKGTDGITRTYNFDKWQRQGADPEKFYTNEIKDSFAEKTETIIVALYTQDENVKPIPNDGKWVPKGSAPSAKDFIKNIYNDDDPNNKKNLPPGAKFTFKNGDPDTNTPGTNKKTTITITYPNGEVETVDVTYNVTGDVVEQRDPNTKPDVPDDFVEVIVKTTDKATDDVTRTFWVNPNKMVTIDVPNPTGKDLSVLRYEFTGWNHPLRDQFIGKTIITAQYREVRYNPSASGGVVETQIGKKPTMEDYAKQINANGEKFKVTRIVKEPDVSKSGMSEADVEIVFENGVTKTVNVKVYVIPDPKIIEKPVPGDCNNGCDQPNVGKGALNTTDHYQYLIGYPDGNFAPNKGMTRAEVATMFTRLLKERPVKWKHYNAGLSDIRPGDWYADTVGYAVQKGIVSGYPDGSFKPNKPITRAEFASIASRFDALAQGNAIAFSDLAPSHWGYRAIGSAASKGWISGYPDNTFRPEKAITRAEVTSVTNRMLNRYADLYWIDAHRAEIIRFGDVKRSDWYFEPIMEATMGHDFIRDRDGKTEHWTGVNGKSFI